MTYCRCSEVKWSHLWLALLCFLPLTALLSVRWYKSVMFDVDCGGHLKRAADANTVELALKEMDMVVDYADKHKLTTGYTTIFTPLWLPPNEDVAFWYTNIRSSRDELKKVKSSATQEERGVVLLKLRQTLLDHTGQKGESITVPPGISIFPTNQAFFMVICLAGLPGIIGLCYLISFFKSCD